MKIPMLVGVSGQDEIDTDVCTYHNPYFTSTHFSMGRWKYTIDKGRRVICKSVMQLSHEGGSFLRV